MTSNIIVEKAWDFAVGKHYGQKYGEFDYHWHLQSVSRGLGLNVTNSELIIAYLHDTLEDTDTTYEELVKEFGEYYASCVVVLTRFEDQSYKDYIDRIIDFGDRAVMRVKLADLMSNFMSGDCYNKRYREAIVKIMEAMK